MKNHANRTSCHDVHSRITSKLVAALEREVRPWVKPWNADHPAGSHPKTCSMSTTVPVSLVIAYAITITAFVHHYMFMYLHR